MKLELNINDNILQQKNFTEFDIKMIIGAALYNNNVTSTGKASEILGINRRTFLEEMGKYGAILINMDINELKRDIENAKCPSI